MQSPPIMIGAWLACLSFVLGIYNQLMQAMGKRNVPQPMVTKQDTRYATYEELSRVEGRISQLQAEFHSSAEDTRKTITANYNELMRSAAEGRSRLHKGITDLAIVIARLEGKLEEKSKNE